MRESRATYSVKEHLEERAFVADFMLCDQIVPEKYPGTLFALTVTGSGFAAMGGGPSTPVGLTGAFGSVGAFWVDKLLEPAPEKLVPAAFFMCTNRHYGWTDP